MAKNTSSIWFAWSSKVSKTKSGSPSIKANDFAEKFKNDFIDSRNNNALFREFHFKLHNIVNDQHISKLCVEDADTALSKIHNSMCLDAHQEPSVVSS